MTTKYSDIFTFTDVFKSVDRVLNELKKPEHIKLDPVRELIAIYERVKEEETAKQTNGELYPLIVLEGLDGCGKSTIGKRLANSLNATLCKTPPQSMSNLRPCFDNEHKEIRHLFYALGNYIAAFELKTILEKTPVVLDRFWHSTISFAIAQAIEDFPEKYSLAPANENIYWWPEDLLRPQIVLYLCVSEKVRMARLGGRAEFTAQEHLLASKAAFKENVVQCYYRTSNPAITCINNQLSKRKVEKEIMKHLVSIPQFTETANEILLY